MMSTDLLYVEDSIEKRRRIFRPSNIISTFYIKNTLRKLLCKLKDQDKNNVNNEIDCSNCNAVYFDESKRSLKLRSNERERSAKNCNCEKKNCGSRLRL